MQCVPHEGAFYIFTIDVFEIVYVFLVWFGLRLGVLITIGMLLVCYYTKSYVVSIVVVILCGVLAGVCSISPVGSLNIC